MTLSKKTREALEDLTLTLIKAVKIVLVYILPSLAMALLLSSELRDWVALHPKLASIAPIINMLAIVLATEIKKRLPKDSVVSKVL